VCLLFNQKSSYFIKNKIKSGKWQKHKRSQIGRVQRNHQDLPSKFLKVKAVEKRIHQSLLSLPSTLICSGTKLITSHLIPNMKNAV
jgi:hypothetical protein